MTGAHGMFSFSHVIPLAESLALVSQASHSGGNRGRNNNRTRPQCTFSKKLGHLDDKFWKKHGRLATPPTSSSSAAHAFQSDPSSVQSALGSQLIPMSAAEYDVFLKFQATKQSHPGNPIACVAKSPSLGPWIIDFGTTDHMCGNELLFSSLILIPCLQLPWLMAPKLQLKGQTESHPLRLYL